MGSTVTYGHNTVGCLWHRRRLSALLRPQALRNSALKRNLTTLRRSCSLRDTAAIEIKNHLREDSTSSSKEWPFWPMGCYTHQRFYRPTSSSSSSTLASKTLTTWDVSQQRPLHQPFCCQAAAVNGSMLSATVRPQFKWDPLTIRFCLPCVRRACSGRCPSVPRDRKVSSRCTPF